ncbi:hypothetical protein OB236_10000 [Paenibacillus sp. WQ 127069]|uniref:Uncharacterized protein n=1 Tax=Paenibacillus baimaensis TaxID=2982185 RepID=A0ABT2UCY6_9BACL|nr:hypothetical protein [Paenibacillus sp. WQ 127069]MCU6792460.1 hypothetical protein [Paenibacillus sp. WQ 127069]
MITLVPTTAASRPVLAVWIYTGGWSISAICMIWFFYLENFTLNWWKAYGEPLIPSLFMGLFMEVGRFTGGWMTSFVVVGIICLIVLTMYVELRVGKGLGASRNEVMR